MDGVFALKRHLHRQSHECNVIQIEGPTNMGDTLKLTIHSAKFLTRFRIRLEFDVIAGKQRAE